MDSLDFDFSGVAVRVRGATAAASDRLEEEWSAFRVRTDLSAVAFLCLDIVHESRGAPPAEYEPKAMRSRLAPDEARFDMPEGSARLARTGPAEIRLARELGTREYFTLENLLRACLAWRLPQRGAALLHAAGISLDGRAFVLVGAQGSGKTTWAELARRAGAAVISDDLVLVECGPQCVEVLGTPFRSSKAFVGQPGRWPLAALLFSRHGSPAALTAVSGLRYRTRIAANLPFVAEAVEHDGHVAAMLERLATSVPQFELTFGRDPSFLDVLRGLGPTG